MIAVLAWPRLSTRLGLGLEMPLAHALVDRLLGFDRQTGEERLQITPVEWGILSFAVAGTLSRMTQAPAPWETGTWWSTGWAPRRFPWRAWGPSPPSAGR